MTYYFDKAGQDLTACGHDFEKLRLWEQKLVEDVTIAAAWPDMPEDLTAAIHKAVLAHAMTAVPVNCKSPDFRSFHEAISSLHTLCSDLHDIFHSLARRGLEGWNDSPLTPLRMLFARGEEVREQLVVGTSREKPAWNGELAAPTLSAPAPEPPCGPGLRERMNAIEAQMISAACWETRSLEGAADALGVTEFYLRVRMRTLGLCTVVL